jgi:hypothetical protein
MAEKHLKNTKENKRKTCKRGRADQERGEGNGERRRREPPSSLGLVQIPKVNIPINTYKYIFFFYCI